TGWAPLNQAAAAARCLKHSTAAGAPCTMRAMCGVAGIFDPRARGGPGALAPAAQRMTAALHHRGPDAGDLWVDEAAGFVLSFNGEIYNFRALRAELEAAGRRFRGQCDTEVIVEGVAQWGVEATIPRLVGMFALALWDRQERMLYLVRDRLGIKPLYWQQRGTRLIFGSGLKALRADPGFESKLDRDALALFLRLAYVPAPTTIYDGVKKLAPGTILIAREGAEPELKPFWSLEDVARDGLAQRFDGSEDEAINALDTLLGEAVRCRMIADVPLGAFLSGGIDSS